jgi:hypothetical protein
MALDPTGRLRVVVDPIPGRARADAIEDGAHVLEWHDFYPPYGPGWVLYYEDSRGGRDSHFVGGDLAHVEDAVASAHEYLDG